MTTREHVRALAEAVAPDQSVSVPARWLLELLQGPPERPVVADLTCAAFGALIDRSPSTVRAWCETGTVPGAWKLRGKEWRIPARAVAELQAHQANGSDQPAVTAQPGLGDWRTHMQG